ncbi:MAG: DUF2971 domain-containing protein [Burkholderiaceae bacterium]|nr:DUF2971 domain-containing protein [Burkholderiaceae bacterium]
MSVETLYKYGRLGEHSESLFSTPTIWFASPASLNDPFECRPWLEFAGTDEQLVSLFVRVLRRQSPNLSEVDALDKALAILQEGRHRDPRFWDFFRKDVGRLLATDIGICCLTKTNTNILMWSHYAADHQGYCLEFAATDSTPFFCEAQEVSYSSAFPVVNFFSTPHETQVDLIFLTKYEGWRYEEEYRIVDHQAGAGLHSYPPELLRSVTFGLRMCEEDRQTIRKWLKVRDQEVKVFEATIHDREFKIVPLEVQ